MRRRRFFLLFVVVVVGGIATFVLWPRPREPQYKGKTLTRWILIHEWATGRESTHGAQYDPLMLQDSHDAVNQIGSNALPWLIKWIQLPAAPHPAWHSSLWNTLDKILPGGIHDNSAVDLWLNGSALDQQDVGCLGFQILGTNASAAVPELVRIASEGKSPRISGAAFNALAGIGPEGLPPLLAVLSNPRDTNRLAVVRVISWSSGLGTNDEVVVRLLGECLGDPDPRLAEEAAEILGRSVFKPNLSVPVLIRGLQDSRPGVRQVSVRSLLWVGAPAEAAVPALTACLNDVDENVRHSATNALQRISEEVLQRRASGATNLER